jgi:hypothetical protein
VSRQPNSAARTTQIVSRPDCTHPPKSAAALRLI